MKKKIYWILVWGLFVLLASKTVYAIPIEVGVFSWEEDFFGPVFRVGNRTHVAPDPVGPGVSFFDVFIDIRCTGDCRRDDVDDDLGEYSISLGEIVAGDEPHSFEDFTDAVINSASLRLTFPLAGIVTVLALSGPNLSEPITYTPTEAPPGGTQPIPEPATVFLLGSGLSGIVIMGRRRLKAR